MVEMNDVGSYLIPKRREREKKGRRIIKIPRKNAGLDFSHNLRNFMDSDWIETTFATWV